MGSYPSIARVVGAVLARDGFVTVEAPPGFGKSQLAESLRNHGFVDVDVGHRAAPSADPSCCVLAIDPTGELSGVKQLDDVAAIARTIVVIGRSVSHLVAGGTADLAIGAKDLALTLDEIATMATNYCDPKAAHSVSLSVQAVTQGWPAHVAAILGAIVPPMRSSKSLADRYRYGPHLEDLIHSCLATIPPPLLKQYAELAHIDRLSNAIIRTVIPRGGAAMAQASGLPLVAGTGGWYRILEPVKNALCAIAPLSSDTAARMAPVLVAEAGVVNGAQLLTKAGAFEASAEVLCDVDSQRLEEADQTALASLLRLLCDMGLNDGRLSLLLAQAEQNRGALNAQRAALHEAARIGEETANETVKSEAAAEILYLDLPSIPTEEARQRYQSQLQSSSGPRAALRLRETDAMLKAHASDLDQVYSSVPAFRDVSADWALAGENIRAAATLRSLTATALTHLGRYQDGRKTMEAACELVASHPQSLAKSIGLMARMESLDADLGRFRSTATLTAELLYGTGLDWVEGYLSWSSMIASGFEGDTHATAHHHGEALLKLGGLRDHPTITVFYAESAIAFALSGNSERALKCAELAEERRDEAPLEVSIASVTVQARCGDPSLVQSLIEDMRRDVAIPHERAWRLDLEAVLASRRFEKSGWSVPEPHQVLAQAERLGVKHLAEALLAAGDHADANSGSNNEIEILVLGPFRLTRGGTDVQIPAGRVAELIKLLALHNQPVPVEVVIDRLWPEAPLSLGRRRLKNLLNRCRKYTGPEAIDRLPHDALTLGENVRVDVRDFTSLIEQLRNRPDDVGLAIQAVDLYNGHILESDLSHEWASSDRIAVQALAASALRTALLSDRVNSAWALGALRRIRPWDEGLHIEVAVRAHAEGDVDCTRAAIELQLACCEYLGVEPAPLPELLEQLYG